MTPVLAESVARAVAQVVAQVVPHSVAQDILTRAPVLVCLRVGACVCVSARGRVSILCVFVWLLRTLSPVLPAHNVLGRERKGEGVLSPPLSASLFGHPSTGQAINPTTRRTTPLGSPRTDAHISQVTTACASSPRGLDCPPYARTCRKTRSSH